MIKLEDDGYCFACGPKNEAGLRLVFTATHDGVSTRFTPRKAHQGYKGVVHGGIITTLLDEAMAHAAIAKGIYPVTAEVTVRFKEPLAVGDEVLVEGRMGNVTGRLVNATGELKRASDGKLVATATAKFLRE